MTSDWQYLQRPVTARWPWSITDQEMTKFGLELSPTPSMPDDQARLAMQ